MVRICFPLDSGTAWGMVNVPGEFLSSLTSNVFSSLPSSLTSIFAGSVPAGVEPATIWKSYFPACLISIFPDRVPRE